MCERLYTCHGFSWCAYFIKIIISSKPQNITLNIGTGIGTSILEVIEKFGINLKSSFGICRKKDRWPSVCGCK